MRIAKLSLKMWSTKRCLMCFRVVSKVSGVVGLNSALLAVTGILFHAEDIQAQNARYGSVGSPSNVRKLTGHVPPATAQLTPTGAAPAEYGWAEQNVVWEPGTAKASGLKIFSIEF